MLMKYTTRTIPGKKNIGLVAHDNCKKSLIDWVEKHKKCLSSHVLYATGTTGNLIEKNSNLSVNTMLSGPLGGDQMLGALISTFKIDLLIFLWDPLHAVPHDPDVKALLRLATVWNIPTATNLSTADFLISSPLFDGEVIIEIPDYQKYLSERIE